MLENFSKSEANLLDIVENVLIWKMDIDLPLKK